MSSPIHRVAIAGATGSLGEKVTEELVKAGFDVTALVRSASSASKIPSGVKTATIDYSSHESMLKALQGQDALVSTLNAHGDDPQIGLFDAAIEAGVKRLIPSEFGSDNTSPIPRSFPVYKPKVVLQDRLKEKTAGTKSSYTLIQNNAFLDWGVSHDFLFVLKTKTGTWPDGGEVPFTVTPLNQVGQGVAGVLKHPAETANRVVRIHGAAITMKKLIGLVQKYTTTEGWHITTTDTEQELKEAYAKLQSNPKDVMAWIIPMIFRAAVGRGMDVNWENKNDDELLGIKPLTDAEVEEIVKQNVPKV